MNVTNDISSNLNIHQIQRLIRAGNCDPMAYLDTIESESNVGNTKTIIRWHRIGHDVTLGKPDIEKLIDKLFSVLIDFACTRKELEDASKKFNQSRSSQAFGELHEKARRLFTSATKSGEPGELLLYFLAEHLLKYPQVLCKFPHKTNPSVHAHGADGVHASVDPITGHLRLHWGEAKFYQKLGTAIDECFESLNELIREPPGAKKTKRRDVELLRDFIALNDPELEQAFKSYLDPDNLLSKKVCYCGLALSGFDLADYGTLSLEIAKGQTSAISARIADWSGKIKSALQKYELVGVTIDAFCIPFPSVQDFRNEFLKRLGST